MRLLFSILAVAAAIFSQLSVDDGLSQASVFCSVQDRDGNVWFGTYNGLNRYDGYETVVFKHDEADTTSLCGDKVDRLLVDRNGVLWVGTNEGICRYDPSSESFVTIYSEPHLLLFDMRDLPDGTLVAGSRKGLFMLKPCGDSSYERITVDPRTRDAVLAPAGNCFWLGNDRGEILFFDPSAGTLSPLPGFMGKAAVSRLILQDNGVLWASTQGDGLYRIAPTIRQNCVMTHFTVREGLCSDVIRDICFDETGNLWIGTDRNVSVLDVRHLSFETIRADRHQSTSLSNGSIKTILKDGSGGIWLGTYFGGVNYWHPGRAHFNILDIGQDNDNSIIGGMRADENGNVWIGTNRDGVVRYNTQTGRRSHAGRWRGDVKDIVISPDGREIWFGENMGGFSICRREGGLIKHYFGKDVPPNVYSILDAPEGGLLLGSLGGLYHFDRRTEKCSLLRHPAWSGFHPVVHILRRDGDGFVWIGSEYSLMRCRIEASPDGPTVTDLRIYPYVNETEDILVSSESGLWVATRKGLFRYDRDADTLVRPVMHSPLPSGIIRGLEEDSTGRIWMGTENGLCLYVPGAGVLKTFTVRDGLPGNTFCTYAHTKDADGIMYFGGLDGLVCFNPDEVRENLHSPSPVIRGFYVEGEETNKLPCKNVVLPYSQRNFSIHFTVPDYISWRSSVFRYKMEGLGSGEWHIADVSRTAKWQNVPAGRYRFVLESANSDGVRCETPAVLDVRVLSPWYLSAPALLAWALLAALSLALTARYIKRLGNARLERERDKLIKANEQIVRDKEDEIREWKRLSEINLRESLSRQFAPGREMSDEEYAFLRKALGIVKANLSREDFSVEDLASALFISRTSLHRRMVRYMGTSALQFIQKVRFDEATVLLKSGKYTISEVTYRVGFSSPSYFATSFKKYVGVNPSFYLKAARKQEF